MDSEALQVSRPTLSPTLSQKRHTNLNTSAKSTSVTKNTSSTFIPREPVKGAVKAVEGLDIQKTNLKNMSFGSHTNHMDLKPYQYSVAAPPKQNVTLTAQSHKSQTSDQVYADIQSTVQYKNTGDSAGKVTGTAKVIKVPVFNGPSHLSYSTYETMSKVQEESKNKLNKEIDSTIAETKAVKAESVDCVIEVPLVCEREVEGQQARPHPESGQGKQQKEVDRLKEELSVQIKVSGAFITHPRVF